MLCDSLVRIFAADESSTKGHRNKIGGKKVISRKAVCLNTAMVLFMCLAGGPGNPRVPHTSRLLRCVGLDATGMSRVYYPHGTITPSIGGGILFANPE